MKAAARNVSRSRWSRASVRSAGVPHISVNSSQYAQPVRSFFAVSLGTDCTRASPTASPRARKSAGSAGRNA